MDIIVHEMEYQGAKIFSRFGLRNYRRSDFSQYKRIYEECFHDMRAALKLVPANCCDSEEELLQKSKKIYILEDGDTLIGSVAIYDNEIDDLVVVKEFQKRGYGKALLEFAVSHMQKDGISPVRLHVTDWNQGAVKLYLKVGFRIIQTETVNV